MLCWSSRGRAALLRWAVLVHLLCLAHVPSAAPSKKKASSSAPAPAPPGGKRREAGRGGRVTPKAGTVVELTAENFDELVGDGLDSPWFVKFYAPWCMHCQQLAPYWKELAKELSGRAHVAKLDAVAHSRVADDWAIDGFPTMKLIVDGKAYDYDGSRQVEVMVDFVLQGYKNATSEPLPKDKSFADLFWVRLDSYVLSYGLPLGLLTAAVWAIWTCCFEELPEEEVAEGEKQPSSDDAAEPGEPNSQESSPTAPAAAASASSSQQMQPAEAEVAAPEKSEAEKKGD